MINKWPWFIGVTLVALLIIAAQGEDAGACHVYDVDYGWSELDALTVYFRDGSQFRIEDDRLHTGWIARQDLPLTDCAEQALPLALSVINGDSGADELSQFDDSLDEGFVSFIELIKDLDAGCYPQDMSMAWIAEEGRVIIDLNFVTPRHGTKKLTWYYDDEGLVYAGSSSFDVCQREMTWLREEVHQALQSNFPRQSLRFTLTSKGSNWIANALR